MTVMSHYLLINGGLSGEGRRLADTHILDLYSLTPEWEVLDEGEWINTMMWIKPRSMYR